MLLPHYLPPTLVEQHLPRSVIQDNLAIVECMQAFMEEQGIHKITLMSVY